MKENVTKRPGRPKSLEKAAAIRHAAVDLFMADGMERTSMDAIAAAAGVSKQTVYSHFKNKDDLFRSCVASKINMYSLDASQLSSNGDIDDFLRHVGRQYLTLLSDPGVIRMFRLMVSQADSQPESVCSFHQSGPISTAHNIGKVVAKHLADGPDTHALAAKATSEYLALVRGDYFLELILGTREQIAAAEMERHIEHCIDQLHKLYELG